MPTTGKGFRYPLGSDPAADIEVYIQNLATDVDNMPGIASMTTTARNALSGTTRWTGRVIWNTTTAQPEIWDGAAWQALPFGTRAVATSTFGARGDLLLGTAASAYARLAAGADRAFPIYDSTQTTGMRTVAFPRMALTEFSYTEALAVSTGRHEFSIEGAWQDVLIRARLGTAPAGTSLILDVNRNAVTMFSTQANRPTFAIGSKAMTGGSAIPDITTLATGDYVTIDVDQVGSTTPGSDLALGIWARPTL